MKTFKQPITEDGKMVGTATSNAVEDGNLGALITFPIQKY